MGNHSGAAGEIFEFFEVQNMVFKGKSMSKTLKISPAASLEWGKSVAAEKWGRKNGAKNLLVLKNGAKNMVRKKHGR